MAAAVLNSSARDELNSIIDSIELNIQYNLEKLPVLIYVGIGTIAGRIRNEDNGNLILDDENYHQFPPALQKLYMQIPNLQIFCIYIDPSLENIPFITKDQRMKQKLNLDEWKHGCNGFSFENKRIKIYPFRQNIIVNSTKEYPFRVPEYVNITNELSRLHKISIENNCTYLYHDFSGNDNTKFIEKYFVESDIPIKNNLDHIIYGLGNGSINGCYYDFRKPEAHIAYLIKNTPTRPLISVFNINNVISSYHNQNDLEVYRDFVTFLNDVIESYGFENIEIITSIMCVYVETFISQFRDHILYILRYIKDYEEKFIKGEKPVFDMTTYGFNNVFDKQMILEIKNIIDSNHNMFYKCVDYIANKFEFEFNILAQKHRMGGRGFLYQIVSNPNKYSWHDTFRRMYE